MTQTSYHQFCPVAMAAEVLGSRWTIVLLRELLAGSTRFNDLRRGVPRMSPALLTKRLRELEMQGVVERRLVRRTPELYDYVLTAAGEELGDVITAVGIWGQRWVETAPSLDNTDPTLLMWDMRRCIKPQFLPDRSVAIQFIYSDLPKAKANYWILAAPDDPPDVCWVDPGRDIDLFVNCDLRTMTAIWMGLDSIARARDDGRLMLVGDTAIEGAMPDWLGRSPFAVYDKRAG